MSKDYVFHPELNKLMNIMLGEKVYDEYEVDDEGNYIMEERNDE